MDNKEDETKMSSPSPQPGPSSSMHCSTPIVEEDSLEMSICASTKSGSNPSLGESINSRDSGENLSTKEKMDLLEEIDLIQLELEQLQELFLHEINGTEDNILELKKPIYNRRAAAIEKIPLFWKTTILNHPLLLKFGEINDDELECLNYLRKVEITPIKNHSKGYEIKFHFAENPYFDNEILEKTVFLNNDRTHTTSNTEIKWKKNINFLSPSEKVEAKSGSKRKRSETERTFFDWFCEKITRGEDNVAEIIREDIYENPAAYFVYKDSSLLSFATTESSDSNDKSTESDSNEKSTESDVANESSTLCDEDSKVNSTTEESTLRLN